MANNKKKINKTSTKIALQIKIIVSSKTSQNLTRHCDENIYVNMVYSLYLPVLLVLVEYKMHSCLLSFDSSWWSLKLTYELELKFVF